MPARLAKTTYGTLSYIQRILTRSLWICTVTINVYVARAVGPLFAEDMKFLASPCYSLVFAQA